MKEAGNPVPAMGRVLSRLREGYGQALKVTWSSNPPSAVAPAVS